MLSLLSYGKGNILWLKKNADSFPLCKRESFHDTLLLSHARLGDLVWNRLSGTVECQSWLREQRALGRGSAVQRADQIQARLDPTTQADKAAKP